MGETFPRLATVFRRDGEKKTVVQAVVQNDRERGRLRRAAFARNLLYEDVAICSVTHALTFLGGRVLVNHPAVERCS